MRNEMDAYRASNARRDRFEQQCNTSDAQAAAYSRLRRARLADPVAVVCRGDRRTRQSMAATRAASAIGWRKEPRSAGCRQHYPGIASAHGDAALVDIANGVDERLRANTLRSSRSARR